MCLFSGYLISSFILYGGTSASTNHIQDLDNQSLAHCGGHVSSCKINEAYSNNLNETSAETSHDIDHKFTTMLFGVLLACCFIGILWATLLLDTLSSFCEDVLPPTDNKIQSLPLKALRVMKTCRFGLLIPLILLNGLELSFYFGTFTKVLF